MVGIRDPRLRPNDILAAVGVYKGPGVKPVYKYLRGGESVGLHLDVTFQGVPISVHIGDKQVAVEVREKVYSITYFVSICQAVILDHRTRQVKFWEEKGYSARKEGLGSLLRGSTYIAKSPDQEICVVGYHFKDFFEGELFEEHLRQVLLEKDGQAPGFSDVAYEINGFALLASILPIRDGEEIAGIIVKFRNIEDIRTTIMERNTAIAAAERKYRESSERSLPEEEGSLQTYGSSAAMRAVRRRAYKLSQMDCNIFIIGEAGTGRTKLAKSIQQVQPRGGPFLRTDCSAVAPGLLEEQLFGREGGVPGSFLEADGGTLLLDEVGGLPMNVQAKLLYAIRRREMENVLEGAAALSDSDIIYPEHIHLPTESAPLTLRQHLRQEEKRFIQQVLAQCGGDRQKAMKQLDLSRSVFYERLKEYGLH